jgi:hypothetical protein
VLHGDMQRLAEMTSPSTQVEVTMSANAALVKLGYMLESLSILSYEDSINPCFKHG